MLFYLEASKYACDDARLSIKDTVVAPITGTINNIAVKVGDKIDKGGVLPYIESMKMENQILAPIDGRVAEIKINIKQATETGKPLVVIEY